jgi:hypothetical protein
MFAIQALMSHSKDCKVLNFRITSCKETVPSTNTLYLLLSITYTEIRLKCSPRYYSAFLQDGTYTETIKVSNELLGKQYTYFDIGNTVSCYGC